VIRTSGKPEIVWLVLNFVWLLAWLGFFDLALVFGLPCFLYPSQPKSKKSLQAKLSHKNSLACQGSSGQPMSNQKLATREFVENARLR
jgi:hypothetical protein